MLIADGEGGAECYTVASKKDQARITFSECTNMVSQSAFLTKHLKKRKTDLYFPTTFGKIEALASDSNSLDGLNSHAVVMDELHCIKDRNLYEVMFQSMSARQQPLMLMITTSGTVRECIYDDVYDYASKIVDGLIINDRYLPIMYELDSRDEWTNPKMWKKANPALGVIKKLNDVQEKVEKARSSPKDLPGILTKDFNIRDTVQGMWLTFDDVNNEAVFNIDDFKDSYCVGGVDLSSTTDLTCATLVIMKANSDMKYTVQMYFLPEELLEKREQEDKIPYKAWKTRGLLRTSEGSKVNYSDVTQWFLEMLNNYGLRPLWVGYDSWNSQYWIQEMLEHGFTMQEVRMGYKTLSNPMKLMGADLMENLINYNNNPILKWNLTNVAIKADQNENIVPVKGLSKRARIDGAVSLLIAYAVLYEHMNDYQAMI